jgi:diadenosine tetraphosphate (Ap4A) HIT family hydrolase
MILPSEFQAMLDQYQQGCVFCDPAEALVLNEGINFCVVADVAPLRAGHVILHSKGHHSCAGDVPEELLPELTAYKAAVEERMGEAFGSWVGYEHGRAGHCLSDGVEHRLCHHFHLHLLPGTSQASGTLSIRFERVPMQNYQDIRCMYAQYGDYLYVEAGGSMDYFPVDGPITRHLLRTLIATEDGRPELADWKSFGDPQLLNEGMERLSAAFANPMDRRVLG